MAFAFSWLKKYCDYDGIEFVDPTVVHLAQQIGHSYASSLSWIQNQRLKLVIIPVCHGAERGRGSGVRGGHWSFLAYATARMHPQGPAMYSFDSLGGHVGSSPMKIFKLFKGPLGLRQQEPIVISGPRQSNGYDCGIWTITVSSQIAQHVNLKRTMPLSVGEAWNLARPIRQIRQRVSPPAPKPVPRRDRKKHKTAPAAPKRKPETPKKTLQDEPAKRHSQPSRPTSQPTSRPSRPKPKSRAQPPAQPSRRSSVLRQESITLTRSGTDIRGSVQAKKIGRDTNVSKFAHGSWVKLLKDWSVGRKLFKAGHKGRISKKSTSKMLHIVFQGQKKAVEMKKRQVQGTIRPTLTAPEEFLVQDYVNARDTSRKGKGQWFKGTVLRIDEDVITVEPKVHSLSKHSKPYLLYIHWEEVGKEEMKLLNADWQLPRIREAVETQQRANPKHTYESMKAELSSNKHFGIGRFDVHKDAVREMMAEWCGEATMRNPGNESEVGKGDAATLCHPHSSVGTTLRHYPDGSLKSTPEVHNDATVKVMDLEGDWAQINFCGELGWVRKGYLTTKRGSTSKKSDTAEDAATTKETVVVKDDWVLVKEDITSKFTNVPNKPDTVVKKGTEGRVTEVEEVGDFLVLFKGFERPQWVLKNNTFKVEVIDHEESDISFKVGEIVEATDNFRSDGSSEAKIAHGSCGDICKIEDDGCVLVRFQDHTENLRVMPRNFRNLKRRDSVPPEPELLPLSRAKVRSLKAQNRIHAKSKVVVLKQIQGWPVGTECSIKKIDKDGDLVVQDSHYKKDWIYGDPSLECLGYSCGTGVQFSNGNTVKGRSSGNRGTVKSVDVDGDPRILFHTGPSKGKTVLMHAKDFELSKEEPVAEPELLQEENKFSSGDNKVGTTNFKWGQSVEARWKTGKWYGAVVTKDNGDGTFTIVWNDDGTTSYSWSCSKMRVSVGVEETEDHKEDFVQYTSPPKYTAQCYRSVVHDIQNGVRQSWIDRINQAIADTAETKREKRSSPTQYQESTRKSRSQVKEQVARERTGGHTNHKRTHSNHKSSTAVTNSRTNCSTSSSNGNKRSRVQNHEFEQNQRVYVKQQFCGGRDEDVPIECGWNGRIMAKSRSVGVAVGFKNGTTTLVLRKHFDKLGLASTSCV